ncbi:MAG: prolipoprotein diacylglyceryl transferase [Rhabdochlamydiaceae bacterium]|nr:prolipoprotein diacylglyceryl transferase [Rhabdochlamydiaceae bacterium]
MTLATFYWDPDRAMFSFPIPLLERPVLWYGFFFALGFFLGYGIIVYLLKRYFLHFPGVSLKGGVVKAVDRLTVYMIAGTLIGARLGDLLFYQDWALLAHDPLSVFKVWEGGLASHGAAVGILLALFLYAKKIQRDCLHLSFLRVLDLVVIPASVGCGFIRLGNFFNQEIIGTATSVPWGVIFGHPADGGPLIPRHPAQLYEAFFLWAVFGILMLYWKKHPDLKNPGRIAGLFVTLVFAFRFLVEFLKPEQSAHLGVNGLLTMGQYLSIPFLFLGVYLLCRKQSCVLYPPNQREQVE